MFFTGKLTDDGGLIISGWEYRPDKVISWAVKTDASGNVEWENSYDSCQYLRSGVQTSDGGYIFVGASYQVNPLSTQLVLIKTDADGNELWSKTFGLPFFSETSWWIEETSDGGYVFTGNYLGIGKFINFIQTKFEMAFDLWSKLWIIKTDADGNIEWDNKSETGFGRCVKQTSDGGYKVTGYRGGYTNPKGLLLIKTDENGNID